MGQSVPGSIDANFTVAIAADAVSCSYPETPIGGSSKRGYGVVGHTVANGKRAHSRGCDVRQARILADPNAPVFAANKGRDSVGRPDSQTAVARQVLTR